MICKTLTKFNCFNEINIIVSSYSDVRQISLPSSHCDLQEMKAERASCWSLRLPAAVNALSRPEFCLQVFRLNQRADDVIMVI